MQLKFVQASLRHDLLKKIAHRGSMVIATSALSGGGDQFGQTVRDQVMLVGAFLCDYRFNQGAKPVPISASLSFHKIQEKVSSCHNRLLPHLRALIVSTWKRLTVSRLADTSVTLHAVN